MASVDIRKADQIFRQLLDLAESERAAYLKLSCDGDPAVESLVRRLLAQTTGSDDRLSPGAALQLLGVETRDFAPRPANLLKAGDRVGKFRLVRELGRGGMATVYLAERDDGQFEQTVALKILDRSGETVARFEQERQILASLNNPNIARLITGGVTMSGVPYVAMEYVEGDPLLDYCNKRRLSVTERLNLFVPIVETVHDAHRQLIVHRDIKSSNILVTDQGMPKLLDFGIAKLLDSDALPHAAPATRAAVPLTPEYASPEQIRGGAMSVATDIYQLGYLLYLLLVGRSPYVVDSRDVAALVDAIIHRHPTLPSIRVDEPGDSEEEYSDQIANRSTTVARLRKRLAGDLDRVILKALHKDPNHRYRSASQFSADIKNVLGNKPVIARPDSVSYRMGKFVRRHSLGVGATSFAVIAAIVGTTVFTYQLAQEKEKATLEATKASEVSAFLIDLIELSEPERAQGREITVREVLDRAAARVDSELERQPQMQATLQSVVGRMYRELGAYSEAESLLDAALATQIQLTDTNHPDVADIYVQRTALYIYQGRYEHAIQEVNGAIAMLQAVAADSFEAVSSAMTLRGRALRLSGELDVARTALEQARFYHRRIESPAPDSDIAIDIEFGNVEFDASNFDQAREHYLKVVDVFQAAGLQPNLDLARAHMRLSYVALELNDLTEAEQRAESSLEIVRNIHGQNHPDLQSPLGALSSIYSNRGEFDAAEESLNEQLRISTEYFGVEHPETATILNNFGTLRFRQDRFADAAEWYRQSVEVRKDVLGPEHPITGMTMSFEAYARYLAGDPKAEMLYRDALEVLAAAYEPGHRYIANVHHDLGRLYVEKGRYDAAEPYLREALEARRKIFGEGNVRVAATKLYLGACLSGRGELAEAEKLLNESRAWALEAHGEDSVEVAHADLWVADWLRRAGHEQEAVQVLEKAASTIRAETAEDHWLSRIVARMRTQM